MKMAKSKVDTNFTNNILRERTSSEKQASKANSIIKIVRSLHAISDYNHPENVHQDGDTNRIKLKEQNIYTSVITDSEYDDDDEKEDDGGSRKRYIAIGVVCGIAILAVTGVGIFFYFKSGRNHFEAKEKESPIAKVQKKCKEYTDWACSLQSSSNKGPSQIVRGEIVQRRGIFPHQAYLLLQKISDKTRKMCGGSLINEKFILTAAHCVDNVVLTSGQALLGSLDMLDSNRTLWKTIKKFHVHPNYNRSVGNAISDIALIELNEEVKFTSDVRPICLNTKLEKHYDPIYASGWGDTEDGKTSQYLKIVKIAIYDEAAEECQKEYEIIRITKASNELAELMNKSVICGAHLTKGTAPGDSGGPLQVKLKSNCENTWEQIGVTSLGLFRGAGPYNDTVPSLTFFAKVEYFVPWISNLVWPD